MRHQTLVKTGRKTAANISAQAKIIAQRNKELEEKLLRVFRRAVARTKKAFLSRRIAAAIRDWTAPPRAQTKVFSDRALWTGRGPCGGAACEVRIGS